MYSSDGSIQFQQDTVGACTCVKALQYRYLAIFTPIIITDPAVFRSNYHVERLNIPIPSVDIMQSKTLEVRNGRSPLFHKSVSSQDGHSLNLDAEDGCGRYKSASKSSELKQLPSEAVDPNAHCHNDNIIIESSHRRAESIIFNMVTFKCDGK